MSTRKKTGDGIGAVSRSVEIDQFKTKINGKKVRVGITFFRHDEPMRGFIFGDRDREISKEDLARIKQEYIEFLEEYA